MGTVRRIPFLSQTFAVGLVLCLGGRSGALADPPQTPLRQESFFSSLKQAFNKNFDHEVVRGHFDLGSPPNVHRYYCLVDPKTGKREPNGVLGQPVPVADGMTGIKDSSVSLYSCVDAENQGMLVTTGYVLSAASGGTIAPAPQARIQAGAAALPDVSPDKVDVGVAMQAAVIAQEAPMTTLRPDQVAFRALYKELVETNTTLSSGSCTLAAERIAAHLKAGGYADKDMTLFSMPEHPKEGGLVAILPGTSKTAKPMLLLGHLDVVEAKREDWTRDPFTLIEENGYFYGRGTADMKAMDATWVDALIRFKQSGYRPRRTIKLALTCGEETTYAFNGADWLAKNRPELISAAFALNEGGGGRTDGHGKLLVQSIQVGEKAVQNYLLETVNAGGHSSIPIRDNAIYQLTDALSKVRDHEFPVKLSDTTRAFFAKAGASRADELGHAMVALSQNPNDKAAEAIVSQDRSYHSMLRTTCVATLLEGGHANNALPQRAAANINCRIFPGETVEGTQAALLAVIGDPGAKLTLVPPVRPVAVPPPLDPKIIGPAEKLVAKYYPGVPLVPSMSTGATDGIFLEAIGIPVYGVPGGWGDPDGNGVHGLNERRSVRSVFVGRDFLTDLVKLYADAT